MDGSTVLYHWLHLALLYSPVLTIHTLHGLTVMGSPWICPTLPYPIPIKALPTACRLHTMVKKVEDDRAIRMCIADRNKPLSLTFLQGEAPDSNDVFSGGPRGLISTMFGETRRSLQL